MKIYISGPITGTTDYKARFEKAAESIRAKGHEAINPCDIDAILNPATTTHDQYMLADIGLLRCCAGIYQMPGWENSTGARLEAYEAARLHMIFYKNLDEIPQKPLD